MPVVDINAGLPNNIQITDWGCGQAQLRNLDQHLGIQGNDHLYTEIEGGVDMKILFNKGGYNVEPGSTNVNSIAKNLSDNKFTAFGLPGSRGETHLVVVNRVRIWQDGIFKINVRNSLYEGRTLFTNRSFNYDNFKYIWLIYR